MEWLYIKKCLDTTYYVYVGRLSLFNVLKVLTENSNNVVLNYIMDMKEAHIVRNMQLQLNQLDKFDNTTMFKERFVVSMIAELSEDTMFDVIKSQVDGLYSEDSELYNPLGYKGLSMIGLHESSIFESGDT